MLKRGSRAVLLNPVSRGRGASRVVFPAGTVVHVSDIHGFMNLKYTVAIPTGSEWITIPHVPEADLRAETLTGATS